MVKEQLINNEIGDALNNFDVNSYDNYGNNILHYYLKNSENINIENAIFLKALVGKGLDINALQSKSPKCSALHLSVKLKKRNILEVLVDAGAKIDITDENGNTPLWESVMGYKNDDPFYIKFLITKGADKNIQNNYAVSPLSLSNIIANYDSRYLLNQ